MDSFGESKSSKVRLIIIAVVGLLVLAGGGVGLYLVLKPESTDTRSQAGYTSATNWWPMELGNEFLYKVTQFKSDKFYTWSQNWKGSEGAGVNYKTSCKSNSFDGVEGSKVLITINPSSGYNRYFTSRYLQFYKERPEAYHGPTYCGVATPNLPATSNGVSLYIHNPVAYNGRSWLGFEGGVWWNRAVANGIGASTDKLEKTTVLSTLGSFPKVSTFNVAAGRYPELGKNVNSGLPGYSAFPVSGTEIDIQNSVDKRVVNSDFKYTHAMGFNTNDFLKAKSTFLNNYKTGSLTWEMEFIYLKAKDVLNQNGNNAEGLAAVGVNTDVFEVIFFEPYVREGTTLKEGLRIACEAWYFAKDIGLVKINTSTVAVMPNDPDLYQTRQLCYGLFSQDFKKSLDSNNNVKTADANVTFDGGKYIPGSANYVDSNFAYHTPSNIMELTSFVRKTSGDTYGFNSPSSASLYDYPEKNSMFMSSGGRYWVYKSDGSLYAQGSLEAAWKDKAPGVVVNGKTVYPWTNGGPDAIEYGSDVETIYGHKGIIVNDGAYWFHDYGTATPFSTTNSGVIGGEGGTINQPFPYYYNYINKNNNTDNLAISGTGLNMLMITKDGKYTYYKKNASGAPDLARNAQGKILASNLAETWTGAPTISGNTLTAPETMMYGTVFASANVVSSAGSPSVPSEKQLIVFQKGAAWVKYGVTGSWETWAGHMR